LDTGYGGEALVLPDDIEAGGVLELRSLVAGIFPVDNSVRLPLVAVNGRGTVWANPVSEGEPEAPVDRGALPVGGASETVPFDRGYGIDVVCDSGEA